MWLEKLKELGYDYKEINDLNNNPYYIKQINERNFVIRIFDYTKDVQKYNIDNLFEVECFLWYDFKHIDGSIKLIFSAYNTQQLLENIKAIENKCIEIYKQLKKKVKGPDLLEQPSDATETEISIAIENNSE